MAEALRFLHQDVFSVPYGDRANVENVAILITAGKSQLDSVKVLTEAQAARQKGIRILTVGVTDAVGMMEVQLTSSVPYKENETYWLYKDFSDLNNTQRINDIISKICKGCSTPQISKYDSNRHLTLTLTSNHIHLGPSQGILI